MKCIDLFAGAGGFSTGAVMAGHEVVWAANHWQLAVTTHMENHPETSHSCQDLHQADWSQVPDHDILLASPACQGHTFARGKERAHHDATRSTAWAVVSAAEYHKPSFFLVENVPEFVRWTLYPAWKMAMSSLGYAMTEHVLDAADFGVPQNRKRLFIVGTLGKTPIDLSLSTEKSRSIASILDFTAGKWSDVNKEGRSQKTIARVENGRRHFGDIFVMPFYGSATNGRSMDRPLGTVTTRDRWAVVRGNQMRMLTVDEYRQAMGFPKTYRLPSKRKEAIHLLGNAVTPPVPMHLLRQLR